MTAVFGTTVASAADKPRTTSRDEPSGAVVYPLHGTAAAQSLNGDWRFQFAPGGEAAAPRGFLARDFDDSSWPLLAVPGHWDLAGFTEPKYYTPEAATGFYRTRFRVNEGWRGQRVYLRFEGVLFGLEAWLNGKSVGSWGSAFNPVTFDVTRLLEWTGENTLSVRVTTESFARDFDTNDCWALSGIFREVWLFALPETHIRDWSMDTTLSPSGTAEARTRVRLSEVGARDPALIVTGSLEGQPLSFARAAEGEFLATTTIAADRLWSAETPVLNLLQLELRRGGEVLQSLRDDVALREVRVDGPRLLINGRPVKLRGVNRHDIWPDTGRALNERQLRRDLELVLGANINLVRTSHYPSDRRFIEMCERAGIYVMCEVPFGFGEDLLKDSAYEPELVARAEATLRRDAHRGAVIIWSIGNENPVTPTGLAAARRVKDLDPSRPICVPQIGSYFHDNPKLLPAWVDIYAPHYPSTERLLDYATRYIDRPFIFTEYAHQLGTGGDRVQSQWEVLQNTPGFAGGALWHFNDQAVLRRTSPTVRPHDGAMRLDERLFFDTDGDHGADGLTYADRTPKTNYWQTRAVYAPIHVSQVDLTGDRARITIISRYDFRNLTGIDARWTMHVDGLATASGSVELTAPAGGRQVIELALPKATIRSDSLAWLQIEAFDEGGRTVLSYSGWLQTPVIRAVKPGATVAPPDWLREHLGSATPFRLRVGRPFGLVERYALNNAFGRGKFWQPHILEPATGAPEGTLRFVRGDRPEESIEGTVGYVVNDDNSLTVAYDLEAKAASGVWLEAGMCFSLPASMNEFHWIGRGPYPSYPGKQALGQIGRHALHIDDLHFEGNRTEVAAAVICDAHGDGLAVLPEGATFDLSIERTDDGVVVGHNVAVSSPGNKFMLPEVAVEPAKAPKLAGRFRLVPLRSGAWPEPLRSWFDVGRAHPQPFRPFSNTRQ